MNTVNIRQIADEGVDINYPIWHPYSSINKNYFHMLNIVKGEGVFLYDVNGRKYLDASSGLWNVSLGYGNNKIKNYIKNQLDNLSFCSLFYNTSSVAVVCANSLFSILPSYFKKIFFNCSGSASIELAMKAMRMYWALNGNPDKNIIMGFKGSYHGTYYGSMGVSGYSQNYIDGFRPSVGNIHFFEAGICSKCEEKLNYPDCNMDCISELKSFVEENAKKIAGIILEPILASYGTLIMSKKYIEKLQLLCDENNILLAFDEVTVGFYRTGSAFYLNKFDVQPDIICMSKGINSGYLPFGATAFSSKICKTFEECNGMLFHGSTQDGNLLACASCIATIDQYKELNISKNVSTMGGYIINELKTILSYHRNVGDIWGEGLIIQINLVKNSRKHEFLNKDQISLIISQLLRNGLIVTNSDTGIALLPMLIINKQEADYMLDIIQGTFKNIFF
ncbi:MAG: aspartate aminotransferase family protein [Clostridium sp.]|nr:aspartate aminotransferase family protein [Clostridium sp.]